MITPTREDPNLILIARAYGVALFGGVALPFVFSFVVCLIQLQFRLFDLQWLIIIVVTLNTLITLLFVTLGFGVLTNAYTPNQPAVTDSVEEDKP